MEAGFCSIRLGEHILQFSLPQLRGRDGNFIFLDPSALPFIVLGFPRSFSTALPILLAPVVSIQNQAEGE